MLVESATRLGGGPYTVDDENRSAVEAVAQWLVREYNREPHATTGVLLIGNVGSGKTLLMRAASDVLTRARGYGFGVKNCGELVRMFNAGGMDGDLSRWMNARQLCLDDLGTEGDGMHFGIRSNVISEIFEHRYAMQQAGLADYTHFTSNLGLPAIKERYGERFISRLQQSAHVIGLGAGRNARDRRKAAPMPPRETVDADNIYTAIHPDVARKMGEAVAPLVDKIKAERPVVNQPATSHEDALLEFRERCSVLPSAKLKAMRDAYLKNYPPGTVGHSSALDYVVAIDEALAVA